MLKSEQKSIFRLRSKISKVLQDKGFQPTYALNHPTTKKDVLHFIKNGIRLVCNVSNSKTTFHFYKRVENHLYSLDLKSKIFTSLNTDFITESYKFDRLFDELSKERLINSKK